ncbi:Ger(x)C family spore germination protein [Priestia megaterium]|uniref:Ger(x)C family spore germination protein n=1 Tax=Priestia megaterium TaxID=1404 RepID=UPI000BF97BDA|nr:Ger(x)C family spore germination protein [Priestia megaterium]PEU70335.1 spore gernimation protein [Priestia megaterium]PGR09451.1 spore gernimation protein [Priestia megaterium]
MTKKCLPVMMTVFLLCGCMSHRNIEQLALVIGVAMDITPKIEPKTGKNQLVLTHQTLTETESGNMSSSIPYKNITTAGPTIHEITRNISLKSDPIYSQHQRALLIGEKASKTIPLDALINQFVRDNEIRRSSLAFVTKGDAKNVLTIQGMSVPPVNLIYELVYNKFKTNKILNPLTMGELSAKLKTDQSFLIQRLSKIKNSVELDGAAIIKDKKAKFILTQHQVEALTWLTGNIKGGIIYGKHGPYPFSYEIGDVQQDVKARIDSNHSVHFDINVQTSGRLSEDWETSKQALAASNVKNTEKKIEKIIRKDAEKTLRLLQNNYKADVIDLHDYVRIHHPHFWKKHQHEWDEIFSQSTIDYHVHVQIKDFGTQGRD